jgi:hypothetical protein
MRSCVLLFALTYPVLLLFMPFILHSPHTQRFTEPPMEARVDGVEGVLGEEPITHHGPWCESIFPCSIPPLPPLCFYFSVQ